MGTVSSANPGLTNLLQTLSNVDSPLLSSPTALSAIENSSPADIVKLSAAATELQEVGAIFGDPGAAPETLFNGTSTSTALEDALTNPANAAGPTASSMPTSQLPAYEGSLQSAEANALLLGSSATGAGSQSVNLLA